MQTKYRTLHLVLGDQLNLQHSWLKEVQPDRLFVLMELKQELTYVTHHIAKVAGFFSAMEAFADTLRQQGHDVLYWKLDDPNNTGNLRRNLEWLMQQYSIQAFHYQLPDEYRLDQQLMEMAAEWTIPVFSCDTEHFLAKREELAQFFSGKQFVMEPWYRHMRKRYNILMDGNAPEQGVWNLDKENRNAPVKGLQDGPFPALRNNVEEVVGRIALSGCKTVGEIDATAFNWPVNRSQSLQVLAHFCSHRLIHFGTYQDAMVTGQPYLYHSLLSFALNTKMLSPLEVVHAAVQAYRDAAGAITLQQVEGFVRQIVGWREYMRGIYWAAMPEFAGRNYFEAKNRLPDWFWTGNTRMNCLHQSIKDTLQHAYAHHIQRLMITGNFALLAGIDPDAVDAWYLGVYIDAIEWVEITNTRGMALFADGGLVGTKPYAASANYISKMSDYCKGCAYDPKKRIGPGACPFNALYWNFYLTHRARLENHPRIGFVYRNINKMTATQQEEIATQARTYIDNINNL